MGCDIHPVIQWLEYPAGTGSITEDHWSDLTGEWNWGRSYDLFAKMAGVRCHKDGPEHEGIPCRACPVVQPRGWPAPRPYDFRLDDADLHTPSWLTLDEFKRAAGGYADSWPEVKATIAAMEAIESTGHKTRLVFAFDN